METLIHGGDIYSAEEKISGKIYDFSANINPLGIPESIRNAVTEHIEDCIHYPDPLCRKLKAALSEREKVPASCIVCGNGAADCIYRLVYGMKPSKGMVLSPGFREYELAMEAADSVIVPYMLKESNGFNLDEDFLEALVQEKPDILFLCNPNNPTGMVIERPLIRRILSAAKNQGTFVVLDECFNDFLDFPEHYTMVPELENWDNLLILKAFTKMYAVPGLRIGYSLCSNQKIIEKMDASGQPWSVSVIAQMAGISAAEDVLWPQKTRKYIDEQRSFLKKILKEAGFKVWDSKANYIFFQVPSELSSTLKQDFENYGILIRSCSNYPGLTPDYFRIAVKDQEENQVFHEALKKIMHAYQENR